MNDQTITRIADELTRRIQEAPERPPRRSRLAYLADNGYSFWDFRSPDEQIRTNLEARGYTAEKAGSDFPRLLAAVRALLAGEIDGLVLSGKTGCGKTTAAKIIFKCALQTVIRPDDPYIEEDYYENIPLVLQGEFVRCGQVKPDIIQAIHPATAVCFDDMGAEHPVVEFGNRSDPVAEYIVRWADAKKRGRLLITTNLDAAGIKARYDDRVLSRLIERCGWLTMEAPDHRLSNLRRF